MTHRIASSSASLTLAALLAAQAVLAESKMGGDAGQPSAAESATKVQPLLVGSKVPKLTFADPDGKLVDLHAAVKEKPAVIIYYRGGW